MGHHNHSPILVPSDIHLIKPLKQQLSGQQFVTDTITWLWTDDTDFFYVGI
jgi:hypothetical protein